MCRGGWEGGRVRGQEGGELDGWSLPGRTLPSSPFPSSPIAGDEEATSLIITYNYLGSSPTFSLHVTLLLCCRWLASLTFLFSFLLL